MEGDVGTDTKQKYLQTYSKGTECTIINNRVIEEITGRIEGMAIDRVVGIGGKIETYIIEGPTKHNGEGNETHLVR